MSTLAEQDKKKRAAKRYPYSCMAECEADGQRYDIKIINISTSGIQFAARNKIESKNPIMVRWRDSKFGGFNPTFLLAREIHNPESGDYSFFYGAQYLNLTQEMKDSLFKLLKFFKDESEKATKQQVEKITPGYLFAVIEQGTFFIKTSLFSKTVSSYFENMFKEIKDYERTAFTLEDDYSKHVQILATHNFHCNVLKSLTYVMIEDPSFQLKFFEKIAAELIKVDEAIAETDVQIKKILESAFPGEKKKELQRQLSESGNRLYYTIQGMLQLVVEAFDTVISDTSESKELFAEIKEQYEQIAKPASGAAQQQAATYNRRSKRPQEFSRAEAIVDIQMGAPKNRGMQYLLFFILFVVAATIGFIKYFNTTELQSFSEKMNLGVEIKSYNKLGAQIDIVVSADEWKKLTPQKKNEAFQKVVTFLENEKRISNSILFDDRRGIIKVISKGQTYVDPAAAAPATPTPPSEPAPAQ